MNKEITINKLEATLNCIKDSETILGGEYFKVHSDYIYALEEEINKIDNATIIVKIGDAKEVRKTIEKMQNEIDRLNNIIEEYENVGYDIAQERADFLLEIQKLNNIIDELEKFFKYAYDNEVKPLNDRKVSVWTICLDKLKELKEN